MTTTDAYQGLRGWLLRQMARMARTWSRLGCFAHGHLWEWDGGRPFRGGVLDSYRCLNCKRERTQKWGCR